jgi:transcriptional regulator GlxA family with amidase domain
MKTTILLLEDGLPSTAITPAEILGSAGALWEALLGREEREGRFSIQTASLDGRPVRSGAGVHVSPDLALDEVDSPDLVIVPAVGLALETAIERHKRLIRPLPEWREGGAVIAAICTGVALLAETGLLDGRPATTHWGVVDRYRHRYPAVDWQPDRFVTASDGLYCCGGVYACVDLSLHLVEAFCGRQVAIQTAKALLLDPPRRWQSAYSDMPPIADHEDKEILSVLDWLSEHFAEEVRVDDLAAGVYMSPRNFARRFHAVTGDAPIRYVHRLRINQARRLLESGTRTVQTVSRDVGYADLTFFRRLFKRYTGMPPQEYGRRFALTPPPARSPS